MFSTKPGFERPNAARRSEKEVYVSRRARTTALLRRYGGRNSEVLTSPIVSGGGQGPARWIVKASIGNGYTSLGRVTGREVLLFNDQSR